MSSPLQTVRQQPAASVDNMRGDGVNTATATTLAWNGRGRFRAITGSLLALLLACQICQAAGQSAPPAQADVSLEYAVKATYLYKLAPFVDWPPVAFTSANAPFQICVVGEDPFDDYLDKAVAGRSFGAHPFAVRRLTALTASAECQIAFIGRLAAQSVRDALDAVRGKPVLTVTDSASVSEGGIVDFVIRDGRVAFEVDITAAAHNHLSISSKLLQLAVAVKDGK